MFSFDDTTKIRYFLPEYNSKLSLVTIDLNRNSLRLNWTIPKLKRYQKIAGKATLDNLQQVFLKAQQIELDIKQGIFDPTLNKYGLGKNKPTLAIVHNNVIPLPNENFKLTDIKKLWDWYKSIQNKTVAESTKTRDWAYVNRYLSYLPNQALEVTNSDLLVTYLRSSKCNKGKGYADTTIHLLLKHLSACFNLAVSMGKLPKTITNTSAIWLDESKGLLNLPEQKKVQVYNAEQINLILQAFANNTYLKKSTRKDFKDSYYTNFVLFRFLTGLRPSECVALQWDDIVWDDNQPKQIIIRKRKVANCALDKGLKTTRKTKITSRIIPCNQQLKELILSLPKPEINPQNLLFISHEYNYINADNFSKRQWKRVVSGLVKDGLLPYYIPFYDERHCFGTHLVRNSTDLKTTAAIMGNSPDTLVKSYLAVDEHPNFIPEYKF
jgi:integrase